MKKRIVFDPSKCSACSACVIACMDQNDIDTKAGEQAPRYAFEWETGEDEGKTCAYLSIACMHCEDAPCVMACPVGCISKDPKTGMTVYNSDRCIGCRSCSLACPFGAPRFRTDGKMFKCDGCAVRVQHGLDPACVRACAYGALSCVTEEEYQKREQMKAKKSICKTLYML